MVLAQQASLLEHQASIAKMVQELAARDDGIERLKAQIDKLEAQLEDLTGGRGAAEARTARQDTECAGQQIGFARAAPATPAARGDRTRA
ncbi:cell division protein FtsB [Paraburkholderia sp. JPY419]